MSEDKCKVSSNTHPCPCTNIGCPNHGHCCDCLANHLKNGGLPVCAKAVMESKK